MGFIPNREKWYFRERKRKKRRERNRTGMGRERDFAQYSEHQGEHFLCVWLCWSWPNLSGPDIWAGVFGGQSVGGDEGMGAEVREIRWLICITSFSWNQDGQPGVQSLSTCFLSVSDGQNPLQSFGGLATSKSLHGGERERQSDRGRHWPDQHGSVDTRCKPQMPTACVI